MTAAAPSLLDAALDYAAHGLPVFPLIPRQKEPLPGSRGFKDATTNSATIRRLWLVIDRNIGIPTGTISGFWALDIDPDGEAHIRRLEAEHGKLPVTRTVTGRGGRHLWFRYVGSIQCSVERVAPKIDVRGDGGYCIAPPSIHENGRRYEWLTDSEHKLAIASGMARGAHQEAAGANLRARDREHRPSVRLVRGLRQRRPRLRDRRTRRRRTWWA
jgi:hypothetical protein